MKKSILLLALLVGSVVLSAQNELKNITEKSCDCMSDLDISKFKKKDLEAQLGLCFIAGAGDHEKWLEKEHGITFTGKKAKKSGEKLGELIAVQALSKCPGLIMALVNKKGFEEAQVEYKKKKAGIPTTTVTAKPKVTPVKSISGKVVKVGKKNFASFNVKGADGFTNTLYWIDYFDNSGVLLEELSSLKTKDLSFTYIEKKVFFADKNNYELVKVITGVK
ncbi:MAG: hypothetical protein ACJAZ2_002390 [Glaciecola sp.]|jgi:hypothetical protein